MLDKYATIKEKLLEIAKRDDSIKAIIVIGSSTKNLFGWVAKEAANLLDYSCPDSAIEYADEVLAEYFGSRE